MDTVLALPAEVGTALTVLLTGVAIPALSAVLNHPGLSKSAKRWVPVGLALVGAALVVWLQAGGPWVEKFYTWVLLAATLVGLAQTLYAAMPKVWTGLEEATNPGAQARGHGWRADRDGTPDGRDTPPSSTP